MSNPYLRKTATEERVIQAAIEFIALDGNQTSEHGKKLQEAVVAYNRIYGNEPLR